MSSVLDVTCPNCGAAKGKRCWYGKAATCDKRKYKLVVRINAIHAWAERRKRQG